LVFPFWEEEEGEEEKALALHDFERKSGFVDNLLVSPLLEKEQQSVFTAFMDDDISFVRQSCAGKYLNFWGMIHFISRLLHDDSLYALCAIIYDLRFSYYTL
jgi:hypothetical protein